MSVCKLKGTIMSKRKGVLLLVQCCLIWLTFCIVHAEGVRASGPLVKKQERRPVLSNEYGEISAVRINDGINGSYLLHFFTLAPSSLLLPLVLNADMIFYVHAGNGRLSWTEEDKLKHINLRRGDVYRVVQGSVFYVLSEAEQESLKFHAIFPNSNDDLREPATGPYSTIQDMVLGFDKTILQATFKVSEEVIDQLLGGTKPPVITHVDDIFRGYLVSGKKRIRLFNLFEEKKEIENCNGWSTRVTKKQLPALEGSNIGLFMVNLTAGSMMEPHWNTMDTEIVVVLEGRGMVRVSISKEKGGREVRLMEVEQGDVFAVPRFHPTAQMAFNNGSFVFIGFSRMTKRDKAQFIAGEASVLQLLSKDVLGIAFNVKRTTLDELLAPQEESVISACTSCAEEGGAAAREEAEGGDEERGGEKEEEKEGGRHHGGEQEPQRRNHDQGVRRILKRN